MTRLGCALFSAGMSQLTTLAAFWNDLGARDPLWAILSSPDKRGNRWDLRSFFAPGEREISPLMHQLEGRRAAGRRGARWRSPARRRCARAAS